MRTISAFLALALAATGCSRRGAEGPAQPLMVFCAAGLKKPVEAVAAQYRAETGTEVQLQFGGSATLLSQLRIAQQGDLFIAADDGTIADARQAGAIHEVIPLAKQHPVIAVSAGNPKGVRALADLSRDGVGLALANPEAASIGKATKAVLGERYAALAAHAKVTKPTVTEIAADVKLGAVDAAIIWDSTARTFGLEFVEVPELSPRVENASAAVLSSTRNAALALRFARYLAAPEKGGAIFQANGFTPAGGDKWALTPEMILYSGGVNRPAVEKLLRDFSEREGATVTTVFNGCGVLCATMKTMGDATNPKFPDAYYACDICFVPPVAKYFPEATVLTETDIGIVVKKGNPLDVRTLADLARPGLRVGLCNSVQSTLGYMTVGMLRNAGLLDSVKKNVSVEVPTADFLINQMRAGGLDAAVVYRVNARLQREHLDYLPLEVAGAKAVQPFSVRTASPNGQLAGRLLEYFKAHRASFEEAGFQWRGDEAAVQSAKIEVPAWLRDAGTGPNATTK